MMHFSQAGFFVCLKKNKDLKSIDVTCHNLYGHVLKLNYLRNMLFKNKKYLTLGLVFLALIFQGFNPSFSSVNKFPYLQISSSSSSSGSSGIFFSPSVGINTSSSSSGTSSQIVKKAFCSENKVLCSSGLVPVCMNSNYKPTCLLEPPYNAVDCCRNTGIAYDCKTETPLCVVASSSSSGSVIITPKIEAYCSNNMVYCSSGLIAGCSNTDFTPHCLEGYPSSGIECCKDTGISLDCRPDIALNCPLNPTPPDSKFKTINIDVVSNPELPEAVELPLVSDAFVNRAGFAYVGSNPSFEIKLPDGDPDRVIAGVDLQDSSGFIFNNIPFTTTSISGQPEKYILTLSLPDSIKEGEAKFALNLSNGTFLNGVIYIFSPLEVSVFKGKGLKTKRVSKPVITRISVSKVKSNVTLSIRGNDFLGKTFLYNDEENNEDEGTLIENSDGTPNSTVSIFPSSLNAEIKKIAVLNGRKQIKINFSLPFALDKKTKSIVVISTPSGTISKRFILKPDLKVPASQIVSRTGDPYCIADKVKCTNGLKPICTNSDFEPVCLAGYPKKNPDCCRDDERSFFCKSFLLKCIAK